MLSIKTRIKIKTLKNKLIATWYFMMKPLACIAIKIDKHKHEKRKEKISKLADENAIRLYSKILVRRMIKYNDKQEEFVVAEWCDNEYDLQTIIDYIQSQRDNDLLRSWAYKLPWRDVDRTEKLTELLRLELEKYDGIECKYIIDDKITNYSYRCKNYKKTLVVELNI